MKNNKLKKSIKTIYRTIKYFVPAAWKYKPVYFILVILDIILALITPLVDIICSKLIVDELLGSQNYMQIVFLVSAVILGTLGVSCIRRIISENLEKYDDLFSSKFSLDLARKVMFIDYSFTENSQILDEIQCAYTGLSWYSGGFSGIIGSIKGIIVSAFTLIEATIVLSINGPFLIPLVFFLVFLQNYFNAKKNSIEMKYYAQLATINRKLDYISNEMTGFKKGKDIRLYHAEKMMTLKAENYYKIISNTFQIESKELLRICFFENVFQSISNGLSYCYLGLLAISNMITVGDFIMLLTTTQTLCGAANSFVGQIQEMYKKACYIIDYVDFMQKNYIHHTNKKIKISKDYRPKIVEFKNVSFKYPNSKDYIFKDFNFKFNLRQKLSIVGENGAGKTTFIKLLCRLYNVDKGEILLDGININDIDYSDYIDLFSVVFQDFKLFSFSLIDNITLDINNENKSDDVNRLLNQTNLQNRINKLDKGVKTTLYKEFDESGWNPSGGEEQKIALIRAVIKKAPIIILDEPNSALDPKTEDDLYEKYDMILKNNTVLYISHRMSSCKICDNIVVLKNGKVAEFGTHDELIANKSGIYSEMFKIQSDYYNSDRIV